MTKKREKVIELPGMTGPGVGSIKIKAIDAATENYLSKKDRLTAMKTALDLATEKLSELIHANAEKIGKDKNGEIVYRYDGVIVSVKPGKEKLQVKEVGEEKKDE